MRSNKLISALWKILIICICIQHMVFNYILSSISILKWSKEIIIILLFIIFLYQKRKMKLRLSYGFLFLSIFFSCLLISSQLFSNLEACIFYMRKYFVPIVIFYLAISMDFFKEKRNRNNILRFIINFACLLGFWGIFQIIVLKDKFLLNIGYDAIYDHLDYTFYFGNNFGIQRNCSTFSSPNICAGFFSLVLLLFISFNKELYKKKNKRILIGILLTASLFLTFSRSNILAFIIALCYFIYKKQVRILKYIPALVIGAIVVIIAVNSILKINIIGIVSKWMIATLSGKENSAAGRPQIWRSAFMAILNHPLGIGAGKVGISASNFFPEGVNTYACENSYFAIALDTGLLGLLSYFIFLRIIVKKNKKCDKNTRNFIRMLLIILLVVFVFSNHIYDLEIMAMFYVFMGISLNYSINTRKEKKNNEGNNFSRG